MNLSEAKKILELSDNFTPEESKSNYRRLVKIFHPDKNPYGAAKFIKIQEAYEYLNKTPEKENNFIDNLFKSFNFNSVFNFKTVEITAKEYLTGTTKEIKVKCNCRCPQPLCKRCLGTGSNLSLGGCTTCFGMGFIKECSCDNFKTETLVIPSKHDLTRRIQNCKITLKDYKIVNGKLTKTFDITLKESLVGFSKTFEDPFGEIHNIHMKNTLVKQNDGYTLDNNGHQIVLLFNIVYPKKLNKHTKKILSELDF
jgi:hypothetical protein